MKIYKRHLDITPQQEMHLQVDHYLDPIKDESWDEILKNYEWIDTDTIFEFLNKYFIPVRKA